MFDDLRILLNNGIYKWCLMGAKALLNDYHWLGVAVLLLPLMRRIIIIFRNLF